MGKSASQRLKTKADPKGLVTKEELSLLRSDLQIFKIDVDDKFVQMDEKNRGYRDDVLNGLDKVMKELENIREDNEVGTHQIRELRVEVDNHEKRISKLETPN